MNAALFFLLKYILIPLGAAAAMYALVHLQLLLLHWLADLGLTHARRARISIITFFSAFIAVLALVLLNDYLGGDLW